MTELTLIRTNLRRYTFKSPKIKEWVESRSKGKVLNLFAGKTKLNLDEIRNDVDETMNADFHMDALDFVREWQGHKFDTIICDPPYCYDNKTEVLTDEGWKLFKNLNKKEKIATLNPTTHELEYHKPKEYIVNYHDGEMIKVRSGSVSLVVTPNHELYIRKLWKTNKFNFVRADNINFGFESKSDCKWVGKKVNYFILPGVKFNGHNRYNETEVEDKKISMNDWLRFFGIWLAEGCADPVGTDYRVRIAQTKKKNRKIIEDWIKNVGFHYLIDKNGFTIYNKQLCVYLRQFGKTKEKFTPKEIKNLSSKHLMFLLEGLILGDGHRKKEKRWNEKYKKFYIDSHLSYCSFSKRLIDDVSEIVLKIGMISTFYETKKGGHVLNITKHRLTPIITKKKLDKYVKKIRYEGNVYCVNVPNHIVYIRRNGKCCWSGNSYRKSMEMYNNNRNSRFKLIADEIPRILSKDGVIVSFGYHSSFIGKVRGFELKELCVFAHGGAQHCTIGIVEGKN